MVCLHPTWLVYRISPCCLQGFDGKCAIHPSQISTINDVFSPTQQEIEHAMRLIQAHKEAVAAGSGVAVVDGKLVEHLHVDEAERIIALANAVAARGAPA
jgi:citrate lyase subunit beta/citryl-CoA lyase